MAGFRNHTQDMIRRRGRRWDVIRPGAAINAFEWRQRERTSQMQMRKLQRMARGRRWNPPFVVTNPVVTDYGFLSETHESFRGIKSIRKTKSQRFEPPFLQDFPDQVVKSRRLNAVMRLRRRITDVGWLIQVPITPTVWLPTVISRRRIAMLLLRRGKRWDAGGQATAVSPITSRRVRTQNIRRGRRWDTVLQAVGGMNLISGRRTRTYSIRRGRKIETVPTQIVVVPTGPALPKMIRSRAKSYVIRRGRYFSPPWVGALLNAFIWYPKQLPRRIRVTGLLQRRGTRTQTMPPAQVVVPTTVPSQRRRVRPVGFLRRGSRPTFASVTLQPFLPAARRNRLPRSRRGKRWDVFKAPAVVVQVWVAPLIRARHFSALLRLGSRFGNRAVVRRPVTFLTSIRTGMFARGESGETEQGDEGDIAQESEGDIL